MLPLSRYLASTIAALSLVAAGTADACTRIVYLGDNGAVMTARSMDWQSDVKTNLWVFPRGVERDGQVTENPLRWTSKYGSVIAAAFDVGTTDGMNEKGLVANLLWLTESKYPERDSRKPGMSIAVWTQYVLDNFATVQEAVDAMGADSFDLVTGGFPGEAQLKATLHLSVSDASGDSAVFEYIDGKLMIHHGRQYQVMTNSPPFDDQLALDAYWKSIGGEVMLPGTNRAADRFVRASYYIGVIPKNTDNQRTVSSVLSVIRNVSVPLGISTPDHPNISSTLWRTLSDQANRIYYFESTSTPNTFWVDLKAFDLSVGAGTKKLTLIDGSIHTGEVSKQFQPAEPFKLR